MKIKNIYLIILSLIIKTNLLKNENKYTIDEINKKIESGNPFTNEEYQIYAMHKQQHSMNILQYQGNSHVWTNMFWIGYTMIGWLIQYTTPICTAYANKYIIKKKFKNEIKLVREKYSFDNIIGYEDTKKTAHAIIENINKQKKTKFYKKNDSIIFYGPSGCGKTNFVYAIAHETKTPIIKVSLSDLMNENGVFIEKFDLLIQAIHEKVDENGPCILFFDEFDFFVGNRKNENIAQNIKIIIQEFLNKLSDPNNFKGVFIFACTNDITAIDDALLRNGRFGIHIPIPLPNDHEIELFYNKYSKNNNNINVTSVLQESKGLSCTALISKFSQSIETI